MKTVIQNLIDTLEVTFDKEPWFGDSILVKLKTIDYKKVNQKIDNSNSIALLLKHMIQWRVFVIEKIQGDKDFDIKLNSEMDWPLVTIDNEIEWFSLIEELKITQAKLVNLISEKSDDYLEEITVGKNYTNRILIEGIIQHDVYHLGQIGLINSLIQKNE